MSYKLGFNNIRKFGQHINNAAETLEYTMSNLLDGFLTTILTRQLKVSLKLSACRVLKTLIIQPYKKMGT